MANILTYDIKVGANTLSPALQKAAEKSQQLTQKLTGISNKGIQKFDKWTQAAQKFNDKIGGISGEFNNTLGTMSNSLQQWKINNSANIAEMIDELGLSGPLDKIARLARNPFVRATAGAAALATGVGIASQAAAQFNNQFRAIQNINQDKSIQQLEKLRQQLNNYSFQASLNPTEAIKGYYDIQSATGKYGDEVVVVMDKIRKFSKATQSDFTTNINATTKAMVQFGLNTQQIDQYLASNAKVINLGIATYQELGEVQTEYLGTAIAANQGIDQANKLFAAMTSSGSNAATAATLAKGALEGLADPSVTGELEKQGVQIFDNAGKMLKLEQITKNLNQKFKTFKGSDLKFQNFAGEIGGNEGFKAFLTKVKGTGTELEAMFDKFDTTTFNLDLAYNIAQNDPIEIQKEIANRFEAIKVKLGLNLGLEKLQLGALKGVNHLLTFTHATIHAISNLQIGTKIGQGFSYIYQKAIAVANVFYGYLNGAYTLLKQNADIVKPILIGTGIALAALNAQALFSAVTALPKFALSLALTAAKFVALNGVALLYNTVLIAEAGIMALATAKTKLFAIAQAGLNLVMSANPIGLVVAGLAILGTGLYIAYQKSQTFRAGIAGAFAVIKKSIQPLMGFANIVKSIFTGDFSGLKNGFAQVIDGFKNFNPLSQIENFKNAFNQKIELEAQATIKQENQQIEQGNLLTMYQENSQAPVSSLATDFQNVSNTFTQNIDNISQYLPDMSELLTPTPDVVQTAQNSIKEKELTNINNELSTINNENISNAVNSQLSNINNETNNNAVSNQLTNINNQLSTISNETINETANINNAVTNQNIQEIATNTNSLVNNELSTINNETINQAINKTEALTNNTNSLVNNAINNQQTNNETINQAINNQLSTINNESINNESINPIAPNGIPPNAGQTTTNQNTQSIKFDKLVENIIINSQTVEEGISQLQDKITQAITNAIQKAEINLSY